MNRLILHTNLLPLDKRIVNQICFVKIFPVHIHAGDLAVLICGVVVNSLIRVAAG